MFADDPFPLLPFAVMVPVLALSWTIWATAMRHHAREVKAVATAFGMLPWPNDSLPRDLSLRDTCLGSWSKLFNVYEGIVGGVQVAVFDCKVGQGKGSWTRTVIAARSSQATFGAVAFDPELTTQRSGEWLILYRPWRVWGFAPELMSADQIEGHIQSILLK